MTPVLNPFHAGELKAQHRTGAIDVPDWASGFIRPYMPDQHREFFSQLPFLVLAGADEHGQHWVTLLDGRDGFIQSPDSKTVTVEGDPGAEDPLAVSFSKGGDVGMLGIELATRRRNRMSGHITPSQSGFAIQVRQSFGNCPQYIHERVWRRAPKNEAPEVHRSSALTSGQIDRIQAADTLFIGSGQKGQTDHVSDGFDASHRGGEPGFVAVTDATHLRIPDYAGNNFFNTIGNLLENPRIGLVFVDFETGGLLHITGRASVDWDAKDSHDPLALRIIDVEIDGVVDRPAALSLRWSKDDEDLQELVVVKKIQESKDITSFHLASVSGEPLDPYEAGQYLPVELNIPGQKAKVRRSYSLSGSPYSGKYRLSIKREPHGLASRFFHDSVAVGDRIESRRPSGEFVVPCSNCPLVLVSAGVGLTPMLSILHAASLEKNDRPVWYVHGTRSGVQHALDAEAKTLIAGNQNLRSLTAYSQPSEADKRAGRYDQMGRITPQTVLDLNAGPEAHYMLCGPAQFIANIREGLEAAGMPAQHIHFETFGPTG